MFIEFFLVSLIVSEILESAKLPASAKLPFLPLMLFSNSVFTISAYVLMLSFILIVFKLEILSSTLFTVIFNSFIILLFSSNTILCHYQIIP